MQAIQPQIAVTAKKYSVTWSRTVVQLWIKSNPRGSEMLCRKLAIDEEILVGLLKSGRPEWVVLKEIARRYEDYLTIKEKGIFPSQKHLTDDEVLVGIIQDSYVKSHESLYNYLTASLERHL